MKITKPNITPGMWAAEPTIKRGTWIFQAGSTNYAALSCGRTDEEAAANTLAIASLPEMLDYLIEVYKAFPDSQGLEILKKAGCTIEE